jgi:hypothetical protein
MPPLQFPQPGEYRVMLEVGGEFLIERRIVVLDLRESQSGETE